MILTKLFITGWLFNGMGLILLFAEKPKYATFLFVLSTICFGINIIHVLNQKKK
jgi:hypothetical protein